MKTSILLIVFISLIVLFPSFNLALTGDDFLGFWRYHQYLDGLIPGKWNNFNYLFTDYGPQDSLTALIHNFFGFNSLYYYIFSYLLRIFAALSLYILVKHLTQNRASAFISSLFLSLTTVGLETTDWSFNMPSYLAITVMNLYLLYRFKLNNKFTVKDLSLTSILFILAIVSQPIRMLFLPFLAIGLEIIFIIYYRNKIQLKYALIQIGIYITLFSALMYFGNIGNTIGAGTSITQRANISGFLKSYENSVGITKIITEHKYNYLLNPFSQVGNMLLPTNLIPQEKDHTTNFFTLFKIGLPILFLYSLISYYFYRTSKLNLREFSINVLLSLSWTLLIWYTLILNNPFPIRYFAFISYLIGGYFTISSFDMLFRSLHAKNQKFILLSLAVALIFLPFLIPWIRDPVTIYPTVGRYLIVSTPGLAILLGILLNYKPKFMIITLTLGLLCLHSISSFKYLSHLSDVRGREQTEQLRRSIPNLSSFGKTNDPMVFYFEGDNKEVLYHSFLFGFPVIMAYQYNFYNCWNIAYTDDWNVVTNAYKDGSSLNRYSIPIQKVKLENIYSYKLVHKSLLDTTTETRNKLIELEKN